MDDFWSNYKRSMCFPDKCSCEYINIKSMVAQPASTISSLPIILIGIYIMIKHISNLKLAYLGFLILLTALGSTFLHMSMTRIGQIADFGGILFIFGWVVIYYYVTKKYFLITNIMVMISGYSLIYFFEPARKYFAFIMGALSIASLFYNEKENKLYTNQNILKSFVLFIIGLIFFIVDDNHIYCANNPWLQGHIIWHIMVSFSLFYLYNFFKDKEYEKHRLH